MSAPDRAVAYAPLKELRDMERDLLGRIDVGNNGRRNLASF